MNLFYFLCYSLGLRAGSTSQLFDDHKTCYDKLISLETVNFAFCVWYAF